MKIALIADLHGNMTAVTALEKDLARRAPDSIWCLGDLVGKGPSSDRTFDWAMAHCDVVLRGNWDDGLGARQFANDAFYHEQLGEKRLKTLRELPLEASMTLSGQRIRMIHGRPVMPTLLTILDGADTLAPLFAPDYRYVIYGDAHRQALRTLNCGLLVNTGSVGNSLGVTHIQYAILEGSKTDPQAPVDITLVNLPYDNLAAVEEVKQQPNMRFPQAFISEITTAVYSRHLHDLNKTD